MSSRPKYKTRQREYLIEYLKTVEGQHITAADVCAYFEKEGIPIGQSTVYRQLENLVEEGIINKYIIDATSPACFEYPQNIRQVEGKECFHCKCEKCGALIHLQCEELAMIRGHLIEHHAFILDPLRTVFYGICQNCSDPSLQIQEGAEQKPSMR